MPEQLALDLFAEDEISDEDEIPVEDEMFPVDALFAPNVRQRCEHCRKRLHPIGTTGRLVCANPYCTGDA